MEKSNQYVRSVALNIPLTVTAVAGVVGVSSLFAEWRVGKKHALQLSEAMAVNPHPDVDIASLAKPKIYKGILEDFDFKRYRNMDLLNAELSTKYLFDSQTYKIPAQHFLDIFTLEPFQKLRKLTALHNSLNSVRMASTGVFIFSAIFSAWTAGAYIGFLVQPTWIKIKQKFIDFFNS